MVGLLVGGRTPTAVSGYPGGGARTKEGSREARMGAPAGRVRMREWSSALGPLEATTPGGAADVRSYVSVHVSADLYK